MDHVAGAREKAEAGKLLFGTVETWLIWKMTKGAVHVTDYSNASRTMLFNINELKWDADILSELDIPESMLPKPQPSSCIYAQADPSFLEGRFQSVVRRETSRLLYLGRRVLRQGRQRTLMAPDAFCC